jgi:hypothetical protein
MAFGLIRVREISSGEVGSTDIHNARKYDELGIETPDNIKKELSFGNINRYYYDSSDNIEPRYEGNLKDCIDRRIKEAGVKVRKDSVHAIEIVVGASPEFFDKYSASGHFSNCQKWLNNRYGKENIVAVYEHHQDESTPHAHFIVVPIVQKEVKWKNKNRQGIKKENRLCARDLTGTPAKLSQLQDDYFNFIKGFGANYGVEFYRGTKASNELKQYSKSTIHELGHLRNELSKIDKMVNSIEKGLEIGKYSIQDALDIHLRATKEAREIKSKEEEIKKNLEKLRNEAAEKERRRNDYNQGDKWKKGRDFSPGF